MRITTVISTIPKHLLMVTLLLAIAVQTIWPNIALLLDNEYKITLYENEDPTGEEEKTEHAHEKSIYTFFLYSEYFFAQLSTTAHCENPQLVVVPHFNEIPSPPPDLV